MKTKKMRIVRTVAGTCFLMSCLTACQTKTSIQEESQYIIKKDTIHVKDAGLLEKIVVAEVTTEYYSKEVVTAGAVQPIPTRLAYIAPPFSGRIVKSHIALGQKVAVNTPLFEVNSPDYLAIQKEFFQAQSNKDLAQKDLQRKEDLLKNGVGSQRELEEAQNVFKVAEKEYENTVAALKVYQTETDKLNLGEAMVVHSPIKGEVIDNKVVVGQYVNSDAEPVATVADLSEVWIAAQVKEKDIRFIHEGDEMDIHISALPGKILKGKVFHTGKSVDEETRSIKVLSVCDNRQGILKLGMYTTVYFLDEPTDCIAIPEKALLQDEKNSYVLLEIAQGVFVKKPVEVDATRKGKAVITSGIKVGERIVCEGGYYFK